MTAVAVNSAVRGRPRPRAPKPRADREKTRAARALRQASRNKSHRKTLLKKPSQQTPGNRPRPNLRAQTRKTLRTMIRVGKRHPPLRGAGGVGPAPSPAKAATVLTIKSRRSKGRPAWKPSACAGATAAKKAAAASQSPKLSSSHAESPLTAR